MRFVVRVPVSNRVASRSAMVDAAQAADQLGFYGISVHDRLIFDGRWIACGARDAVGEGDDRDIYEPLVTLSYLAGKTERVRLMVGVIILPLREVILLAKQAAVLDVLSEGRLMLGVGVGSQPPAVTPRAGEAIDSSLRSANVSKEFATLRVPPRRGWIADEYIRAMRTIWTQPSATFSGKFVHFEEIQVFPKPLQPGGPPILVGGSSPAALRRVAQYGDGWLPNLLRPQQYAESLVELQRQAAELGRTPSDLGLNVFTCLAPTDEAALAIFQPTMGSLFKDQDLQELNLVGSPDTVISRLRAYQAAGVNLVELKPIYRSTGDLLRMLELIAREVLPAFNSDQ